ncbi:MAG: AMP-binding protein [Gammaproteobacteria bacterium]|nr:AMP-binding protein [Gammaproteobacteria bacterium]
MQTFKATNQSNNTVNELIQVINGLVSEFHQNRPSVKAISLDSHFEKDLGLDSLARVELIARIEKKFKLALPEQTFAEAESVRDLLRAIQGAETPREFLYTADISSVELDGTKSTPDDSRTLIDVLNWHVSTHPDRPHIQMYTDAGNGEVISYKQLKDIAMRVAGGLQQRGLKSAEPVALMLPSGPDYFYSFFGILLAGGIPVPVYPPARPSQLEDHMRRHVHILNNCLAKTFITVPEAKKVARLLKSQVPNLQHIVSAADLVASDAISTPPVLSSNDVAFLQYTSGSTGNPKGVVLTHANLLTNIRAMGDVVEADSKDVFVSWLPLYHDMGLIGAWLSSLYFAALFVVMSPLSFLARPERWLWAIHHYHGTLSASPNFGYEYCLRRLKDEDIKGLDLSSWRAAFNGAESVSPKTLSDFSQRFEDFGFNGRAMMPVYGLAESTVGLAFPPLLRGPVIDSIERNTFMQTGVANAVQDENQHALRFVSSGLPLANHQIRVIGPTGHELPERHEGRLEFHGPSSTSGYYRETEKTRSLFDGEWLDTGDLAYIAKGELFLTGRIKDIIIRAGRNIYPHELEEAVGNVAGIRTGRVAVFGSEDKHSKTERLIVIAETRSKDDNELEKLRTDINTLATDLIGSPPDEVVLAPPGTVLKTSSGKIRRTASRELFEKGKIGKSQASVYLQVTRIAFASILPQIRRLWRYSKAVSYALYCWATYTVLASIVWLTSIFLPCFPLRWAIAKNCAALFGKLTATKVTVNGMENIPVDGQPYVLVSNHASYLDSYALIATLPGNIRFTAKKELARNFYNRIPLKNIHTEFVDRYDTGKSLADTHRLANILKQGNALMFFAEGTFTRIPGLRPFHLGAFTVAAEAEVPVIPVAIRGTRSILRSGSWFPHHGSISIDIGEALNSKDIMDKFDNDIWHAALELRNQSREFILRHCGEPDLAQESARLTE